MSIFQRIFRLGSAQANAVMDKFEDPIRMTEQGIRELKADMDKSIESLAAVKAMAIKTQRDCESQKAVAAEYERKAVLLLQKAKSGEIDAAEADRLATEALTRKEEAMKMVLAFSADAEKHQVLIQKLEGNINTLKSKIKSYENEYTILSARAKVSQATVKLNKQLTMIDSNDTIAMLEKMKSKVEEDEALADSYGEIATADKSIDDQINKALNAGQSSPATTSLAELKAKMGL